MQLFKKKTSKFFTSKEEKQLIESIKQAELQTSGEIKVHVESRCEQDAFSRGLALFEALNMHQTKQRNGVLIYLALTSKKFAVIADEGINQVVPTDFWEDIKEVMHQQFQSGKIIEGTQQAILMAGEQLKTHFPYQDDDENEISDELSIGD